MQGLKPKPADDAQDDTQDGSQEGDDGNAVLESDAETGEEQTLDTTDDGDEDDLEHLVGPIRPHSPTMAHMQPSGGSGSARKGNARNDTSIVDDAPATNPQKPATPKPSSEERTYISPDDPRKRKRDSSEGNQTEELNKPPSTKRKVPEKETRKDPKENDSSALVKITSDAPPHQSLQQKRPVVIPDASPPLKKKTGATEKPKKSQKKPKQNGGLDVDVGRSYDEYESVHPSEDAMELEGLTEEGKSWLNVRKEYVHPPILSLFPSNVYLVLLLATNFTFITGTAWEHLPSTPFCSTTHHLHCLCATRRTHTSKES